MKDPLKELNAQISNKNKAGLLDDIVDEEMADERRAAAFTAGTDPYETTEVDPVYCELFKASFMRPLKDETKEHCRRGHQRELPVLKDFIQHSLQGLTCGYKVQAVFQPPLVKYNNRP